MERREDARVDMQEVTDEAAASSGKKPWAAYNIIERAGLSKAIWSRVGSAWINRDGSISVVLDSFPIGGKIHVREDKFDGAPKRGPLGRAADLAGARADAGDAS
jgi:hypothetical protein